jgi:hypothetical protein
VYANVSGIPFLDRTLSHGWGIILRRMTMESKQGIRSGVEDIISEVNCERDCECHNSGFENLGRVTIFGEADLVECLEDRAKTCESAVHFADSYFCYCPVRAYIAKNLNR